MTDLRDHMAITSDAFPYVLAYLGAFPPEHGTSSEKEIAELLSRAEFAYAQVRNRDTKHWLELCMNELKNASVAISEKNLDRAQQHIRVAREHFEDGRRRRKLIADFIISTDGTVRKSTSGGVAPPKKGRTP